MPIHIQKLNKILLRYIIKKFPPNGEYIIPRKYCFLIIVLITNHFIEEQQKAEREKNKPKIN